MLAKCWQPPLAQHGFAYGPNGGPMWECQPIAILAQYWQPPLAQHGFAHGPNDWKKPA